MFILLPLLGLIIEWLHSREKLNRKGAFIRCHNCPYLRPRDARALCSSPALVKIQVILL